MSMRLDNAPWRFFWLVLVLSVPFYLLGATGAVLPFVSALPISALGACAPMIAALVLVLRQSGAAAAGRMLASAFHVCSIPNTWWVLVALAIMPAAFAVTGGIVWMSGASVPTLLLLPFSAVIPAFALFFIGAVTEEIGWQGYAYPTLAGRYSALIAALIIGVVWALWHLIPFAMMGRSATWILWHSLGMILMRIIIVWLVANAGQSVLIAVLFHMMSNSVWGVFADFDPYYTPAIMFFVLLAPVTAIIWHWGPAMPTRFRFE